MKQYKFNEEDLERLYDTLQVDDHFWWVESKIDQWVESLEKEEFNLDLEALEKELDENLESMTKEEYCKYMLKWRKKE